MPQPVKQLLHIGEKQRFSDSPLGRYLVFCCRMGPQTKKGLPEKSDKPFMEVEIKEMDPLLLHLTYQEGSILLIDTQNVFRQPVFQER